jgi:hypothetical protein
LGSAAGTCESVFVSDNELLKFFYIIPNHEAPDFDVLLIILPCPTRRDELDELQIVFFFFFSIFKLGKGKKIKNKSDIFFKKKIKN